MIYLEYYLPTSESLLSHYVYANCTGWSCISFSILQVLFLLVLMVMDVGFSQENLLEYYFLFVLLWFWWLSVICGAEYLSFCVISGGYNIKTGPGCSIELMKFDMGGSAAVLGAAKTIGQIKPPGVEVSNLMFFCPYFASMNIILIDQFALVLIFYLS